MGNQTPDSDVIRTLHYINGLDRVVIIDCVFRSSKLLIACSGLVMYYYGLLLLSTSDSITFPWIHTFI